jgi:hypothetical protein
VSVPALPVERRRRPYVATVLLTGHTQAPIRRNPVAIPVMVEQLPTDDRTRLLAVLGRARRRAAAAMPSSPDWEAAVAGVDSFELELDALDSGAARLKAAPRSGGATTTLDFGPVTLPDAVTIQGAIVGRADRARALRRSMRDLADRAATRYGFMRELERLASRNSFVVEVGAAELTAVRFYAWENQPPDLPR